MDLMNKELQQLLEGLRNATEKFNGQEHLILDMKQKMDEMSQEIIRLSTVTNVRNVGPVQGFQSTGQAKHFLNFVRDVVNNRVQQKDLVTTVNETTAAEGGYLVPDEFVPTLISMLENFGVARRLCTIIPMKTDTIKFPKLTGGLTTYWVGEGQTIPKASPTFAEVTMNAKKMATLVPLTSEILEDSSIAIANLIATLIAQAIAKEEDRITFVGKTADAPWNGALADSSVVQSPLPATKTHFYDVTADNLADVIASMTPMQAEGSIFACHRTIFNVLRKLKSTTGEYIYTSPRDSSTPGEIWGYPIHINETMPSIAASAADTPFIFFGNPKHIYLGDRRNMTMALSPHVGFAEDKIFVRVIERIGFAISMTEALRVVRTAAS